MPLIVLSEERIARELARCVANEHAARAERRRLLALFAVIAASLLGEIGCLALAMHLIGDPAQIAQAGMVLFGVAPVFVILFQQLMQRD